MQNNFWSLINKYTSVFYLIEFIFAGKFLFIQLRKKATVCPSCWHKYIQN